MPTSISGVPTDPHSSCGSTQRYNAYNGFVYSVLKETKPTLPALSHRAEMSRDLHCSRSQDTPELIAAHLKPTPYFSPQTLRIFSTDFYSLTSTFIFLSFPGAKPPPTSTPATSGQNFRPKKKNLNFVPPENSAASLLAPLPISPSIASPGHQPRGITRTVHLPPCRAPSLGPKPSSREQRAPPPSFLLLPTAAHRLSTTRRANAVPTGSAAGSHRRGSRGYGMMRVCLFIDLYGRGLPLCQKIMF